MVVRSSGTLSEETRKSKEDLMRSCVLSHTFRALWLVFALSLIVAASCSDYECTCPEGSRCPVPVDATVVDSLAAFYEAENTVCYAEVLHESFRFVFTEAVAESLDLDPETPWWGKEADLAATANMFAEASVTNIRMDLEKVIDWYAYEDDLTGLAGWRARFDLEIDVTIEEAGREPLIFIVRNSWLDIMVVPGEDGRPWSILWIAEIEKGLGAAGDGAGGLATEPFTWGGIKALFAD
jgi:hypothetical protein